MYANAVWISKAEKSYVKYNGKPLKVFEDVNMLVPRGSIYGLLGPSGCGKTSILRCIIGRQRFDKGKILVLGYPPGSKESKVPGSNVGYMPQDICLVDTMSISENIWYYGALFGLSDSEIDKRMTYYLNLLRLPSKTALSSELSGGEARRVSLTIALLHKPKLIILDEPTVGIDPIVKANIWNHLSDLVSGRETSIIVTTHYIEEAYNAHRIGMMHAGTIVAEDSAQNLLSRFNCSKLEDVFLKLSCNQDGSILNAVGSNENHSVIPKIVITGSPSSQTLSTSFPIEELDLDLNARRYSEPSDAYELDTESPIWTQGILREFCVRKRPLQSIIMKNLLFFMRFPGALASILFLSLSGITLFYFAYDGPIQPLDIKVVNEDLGLMGKQFLGLIDPHVLKLISYDSMTEANKRMDDAYGIIHLNRNFSDSLMTSYFDAILQNKKTKDAQVYLHNHYYHIKIRVVYQILNVYHKFVTTVNNSTVTEPPIRFNSQVYEFFENPTFRIATFNTVTLMIHFVSFGGAILQLFVELKKGYLERNFVAGITSMELFFGMMTVQSLVILVQTLASTILFVIFFHEIIKGSWILIFLLFLTVALSGSCFGLAISVIADQFYTIVIFGAFCSITSGCTTAAYFPIESMPYFFQYFCKATPLFYPIQALKMVVHYGSGLNNLTVLAGFLMSFLWMGIFLVVFFIFFNSIRIRGH